MSPDYDLSGLETSQVDLWLFLRVDAICARILTDQAKRRASTRSNQMQSQPRWHQGHHRGRLHVRSASLPGRIDMGALNDLLSQPILPPASPASSVLMRIQVVSPWVH